MEMDLLKLCIEARIKRYEKAIDLVSGTIPWENGFYWPDYPGRGPIAPENIHFWRGCLLELRNTLDMINAKAVRRA